MTSTPAQVTRARFENWKAEHQYGFWLVQRIEPGTRWFGGRFDLDYMGSAAFEFGASHESLARIRTAASVAVYSEEITCGDVSRMVYFVGSHGTMQAKMDVFKAWLNTGLHAEMYTWFVEALTGATYEWDRTVAWWSFDADVLWTLDEKVAEQLLHGILHAAK